MTGLGSTIAGIRVYIGNRPPLPEYEALQGLRPLQTGEIASIARQTGNHWRKVFNVLAKILFGLDPQGAASWQQLRDQRLLQADANEQLLFSAPDFSHSGVHIICGKTYAEQLGLLAATVEIAPGFFIRPQRRLIVCPYFDYRQLSDVKISFLQQQVQELQKLDYNHAPCRKSLLI